MRNSPVSSLGLGAALAAGYVAGSAWLGRNDVTATRTYWPTAVSTLAAGRSVHTHVAVTGRVRFTRLEDDGDLHIRLDSPADTSKFIIAECIPALPCTRPARGSTITVKGISRFDPEHGWYEVHPVESWK